MLGKIVENETVSYICPMKAETEDDSVFVQLPEAKADCRRLALKGVAIETSI